ncbi:MAG: hypothetical protein H6738_01060 [Alphaproteobacteria bacterium]|nr:hypothetical protein [Alphaproteobacteria bacterium]MCB9695356.1 hypothetical protein [Alphaproteobacteria bacterium]
MDPAPPEQLKTLGIANIIGGMVNMTMGWAMGSMVWSIGGTVCSGVLTCGMCPVGGVCGFVSMLIIPLGMVELGLGIALMANPQPVKGILPYLPFAQIAAVLLGDFVSPILGIVGLTMVKNPDVAGYIEEI